MTEENTTGMEIAVIGMAGQFPGAKNIDEFWWNLKNGVESFTLFSDEELLEAGVDSQLMENPNYVKSCGGVLENREYFDAAFFGYKPTEAEVADPQTRIFLQCAWHALEDAAYDPGNYKGLIGLYAGSSNHFRWEALTYASGRIDALGPFAAGLHSDRDYLCSRVSYHLGLNGPAVYVKTACSTSLVAVHLAVQAILNGECDMALAGGVSVTNWGSAGYLYQEGMIVSPDGHCRAFDAKAKGTVGGDGVGVVVLKRLEEALEDQDFIHAVIKGTAVNNDGMRKIGFTAPSIDGQAAVIREALQVADVDPETVTYIETHGTGTPVGDPIEIEALKTAFAAEKKGFCGIGAVKTNIGHLDAAAGIAGLIKTVLALKHRALPPSLLFKTPNPRIDFENSPFRVNTRLSEWKTGGHPLRAGVSSFGIGGTNAHTILEESPPRRGEVSSPVAGRNYRLILLSAKTQTALEQMTSNLLSHFKINLLNPVNPVNPENPGPDIGDIAYSLQVGRKAFDHRRMLVCSGTAEAAAALSEPDSRKVRTGTVMEENPSVVFMFSGLGAQYVNMGRELYQTQPVFREEMDRCFEILKPLMDCDIKDILYPGGGDHTGSPVQGDVIQPVVFIFEYALAKMVTAWGIQPYAVIGYSFGEYTAACFAGVLSLEDALKLVVLRSRLVQTTSPGAMLSVPLPEKDVLPLLDSFGGGSLSLSIDNGPSCVVSSPVDRVEAFETWMKEKKYLCTRLPLSRAIHSHLMDPILEEFRETVSGFMLNEPQIPYISNVTGNWLENKDAVDAGYWATHLRGTVRFADGVKTMLNDHPHSIFLEVGPGYDLCTLLRHFLPPGEGGETRVILNLVEQARVAASESHSDTRYLLNRLGRLWLSGVAVDWSRFYAEEKRRRVPLPVYPFEGKRYWIDGDPFKAGAIQTPPEAQSERKTAIDDWFYCPSWKQVPQPRRWAKKVPEKVCWLVFADETGLGDRFAQRLRRDGHVVAIVRQGTGFAGTGESGYTVNPREHQDYNSLFSHLGQADKTPGKIVHFWSVTNEEKEVEKIQELGFYSLIHIAQAAGKQSFSHRIQLAVISNGLHRVTSEETLCPAKATILGAVKVIPKEYFNIGCRSIDILLPGPGGPKEELLPEQLQTEMFIELPGSSQKVVAYRGDYRWVQVYEPLSIETYEEQKPLLKAGGVYLILGGLGGIGLELAGYLTGKVRAKLVLTHRSDFPSKDQWREWLKTHDDEDPVSGKIRKVQRLEELGAEVLVCRADAADEQRMRDAVNRAVEWFGGIDGVIHAAGLAGGGMIPLRTPGTIEPVLVAKVQGTLVLDRVLNEKNIKPGFIVLCSSLSGVLGFFGQVGYCAANAFLDAYAHQKTYEQDVFTLSIDWDFWKEVGMGVETVKQLVENQNITDAEALLSFGIEPSEGISIFDRLLHGGYPQVIVSTWDLSARIKSLEKETGTGGEDDPEAAFAGTSHPRPDLSTEYEPPESEFEKNFAGILQKFFGFDRVGIHDNLFEYGITSLDMIHINNVLTKKIETDIPIVVMFEYPTIHALGQYLGLCDNAGSTAGGEDSQVEDLDEVEDLLHQSLDVFGEE